MEEEEGNLWRGGGGREKQNCGGGGGGMYHICKQQNSKAYTNVNHLTFCQFALRFH